MARKVSLKKGTAKKARFKKKPLSQPIPDVSPIPPIKKLPTIHAQQGKSVAEQLEMPKLESPSQTGSTEAGRKAKNANRRPLGANQGFRPIT